MGIVAAVQLWPDGSEGAAHAATGTSAAQAHHAAAKPAKPTVPAVPVTAKPKAVKVRIVARSAPSWLGVTNAAGKQLYWNILQPGQAQEFSDASKLDVILGDAAAVDLVVNGHDLGRRGTSGQVFRASYGPASID